MNNSIIGTDGTLTFRDIAEQLCASGIDSDAARRESAVIIESVLGITKSELLLNRDINLAAAFPHLIDVLEAAVKRRVNREPLQYILGEWDFMNSTFKVGAGCLIPRADTEIICEKAIAQIPHGGTFADLCTGSGCIAISILLARTDIKTAVAVELSPEAAEYARENARNLGVEDRLTIITADVTGIVFSPEDMFDMIISNPPYIPARDVDNLAPELFFEPRLALDGGGDGLDIVRSIFDIYPAHINEGGAILIEFGYDQRAGVEEIIRSANFARAFSYEFLSDYGNNDRAVFVKFR